jgi:hypothetical protein
MRTKKKESAGKQTISNKAGSSSPVGFGKADSVISRRNQNGTVILMRLDKASSFYKIDGIAAEVWACLEAPKALEPVIDYFAKRYPAKAKSLHKDIDVLVKKLVKLDLLAQSRQLEPKFPELAAKKPSEFGNVQEFDLEQIETEVLNESVYLDVFAGSDFRLKTDVAPIRGALSKVLQLDGVTHAWKTKGLSHRVRKNLQPVNAGLIAQQVAEQMPELVRKDRTTGVLAVNYQKLNSYLVEAIKDLNGQLAAQEKRIKQLEARLA